MRDTTTAGRRSSPVIGEPGAGKIASTCKFCPGRGAVLRFSHLDFPTYTARFTRVITTPPSAAKAAVHRLYQGGRQQDSRPALRRRGPRPRCIPTAPPKAKKLRPGGLTSCPPASREPLLGLRPHGRRPRPSCACADLTRPTRRSTRPEALENRTAGPRDYRLRAPGVGAELPSRRRDTPRPASSRGRPTGRAKAPQPALRAAPAQPGHCAGRAWADMKRARRSSSKPSRRSMVAVEGSPARKPPGHQGRHGPLPVPQRTGPRPGGPCKGTYRQPGPELPSTTSCENRDANEPARRVPASALGSIQPTLIRSEPESPGVSGTAMTNSGRCGSHGTRSTTRNTTAGRQQGVEPRPTWGHEIR